MKKNIRIEESITDYIKKIANKEEKSTTKLIEEILIDFIVQDIRKKELADKNSL